MSQIIPNYLQIGSRIQVGNDRATIRFVGTVKNTKGDWLGVEWDDPNRGKHNGTHQDVEYFSCRYLGGKKKKIENIPPADLSSLDTQLLDHLFDFIQTK